MTDSGDEVTEVVSTITWSGGTIKPGEFTEFPVSLGPLPEDVESLSFPSVQTYEGGEVVAGSTCPMRVARSPSTRRRP